MSKEFRRVEYRIDIKYSSTGFSFSSRFRDEKEALERFEEHINDDELKGATVTLVKAVETEKIMKAIKKGVG